MAEQFFNYVGGQWKPSESGRTFEDINPARTTDVIGTFPESTAKDVDEAVVEIGRAHV